MARCIGIGYETVTFVLFIALGCSSSQQTFARPRKPQTGLQKAYIVENAYSTVAEYDADPLPESGMKLPGNRNRVAPLGETAEHIRRALSHHKIEATVGPETSTAPDVDFIVRYEDVWQWDIKKYLRKLVIGFYDAKTGEKLAETTYIPQKIVVQTFPTPEKKVPGIIESLIRKL